MSDIPPEDIREMAILYARWITAKGSTADKAAIIARAITEAREAGRMEERERCAGIAEDLQYSADAKFNALIARGRKGEKHLELAAATAAGMSHQSRNAAAAIRKGEPHA